MYINDTIMQLKGSIKNNFSVCQLFRTIVSLFRGEFVRENYSIKYRNKQFGGFNSLCAMIQDALFFWNV